MRVLHLVKTVTGARWALAQIEVLQRLGVDVVVALPSATSGLAPDYRRAGAGVIEADLDFGPRSLHRLPEALRRCRALVDTVQPDLIHSHFVSTTLVARWALGRHHTIPRIFQVPGPLHLEHAPFAALDLYSGGPRDHWIGTCAWTQHRVVDAGIPSERVFLSYYGSRVASLGEGLRDRFRSELGLSREAEVAGIVAYLYAPKRYLGQTRGLKGHEDFIDAVRGLSAQRPQLTGVVVGGPWAGAHAYEKRLWKRAEGAPIRFTGTRRDIPSIYADLNVAVHPSLSENCGGAVESLAAGVPTIATRVGGLPDVVIEGDTGWLVPPRDPHALAEAIRTVLRHPQEARRRALRGQALVRERFDVERTGREVADIYRNVLGRAPASDTIERLAG